MERSIHLRFNWSVSKGRDTYGYNICSLYVDGVRAASCNGGGYDLEGTALADWMEIFFKDALMALAGRARAAYCTSLPGVYVYTANSDKPDRLYGLFLTRKKDKDGAITESMKLDGDCGFSPMTAVLAALGYTIERIPQSRRIKNSSQYTIHKITK